MPTTLGMATLVSKVKAKLIEKAKTSLDLAFIIDAFTSELAFWRQAIFGFKRLTHCSLSRLGESDDDEPSLKKVDVDLSTQSSSNTKRSKPHNIVVSTANTHTPTKVKTASTHAVAAPEACFGCGRTHPPFTADIEIIQILTNWVLLGKLANSARNS